MNAKTLNGIIKLTERAKKAEAERDKLKAELQQLMAENIVLRGKNNALQAKLEPEPIGWLYDFQSDNGMVKNWFTNNEAEVEQSHALNIRPLYVTPPGQSSRIAELEQQISERNEALLHLTAELHVARQRLAALQANREPLSDDDLDKLRQSDNGKLNYVGIGQFKTIARAIEVAHGITGEYK